MTVSIWVLLVCVAVGKTIKSYVEFDGDTHWQYVTKFGMSEGTGLWSIRVKLAKGNKDYTGKKYPLDFSIYIDEDWETGLNQVNCTDMRSRAKRAKSIELPADGTWSEVVDGSLTQKTRPRMWYFTLSDCEKNLGDYSKVRYELTILNADHSHFSIEQQGMIPILACLMGVFLFLLSNNVYRLYLHYTANEELECSLVLLNFAACCTLGALLFSMVDLWAFADNGKGLGVFTFVQQLSDVMSQILIAFILIGLAEGYTIKSRDFPSPETYIPLFLMITMAYVVIIAIGMFSDDAHYKFSKFEGWSGWGLVLLRVCLYAWFVFNLKTTYTKGESLQVQEFLRKFTLVGSLYFLSLPGVIFISYMFPAYLRAQVIFGGCIFVDMAAQVVLTLLFTQRGKYHQISTYSDSVLPGGKLHY